MISRITSQDPNPTERPIFPHLDTFCQCTFFANCVIIKLDGNCQDMSKSVQRSASFPNLPVFQRLFKDRNYLVDFTLLCLIRDHWYDIFIFPGFEEWCAATSDSEERAFLWQYNCCHPAFVDLKPLFLLTEVETLKEMSIMGHLPLCQY